MWSTQARKSRDQVDAAIGVEPLRQAFDLASRVDQFQPIANPLDSRSGCKDRAFDGVAGLSVNAVSDRCQQTIPGT